MRIDLPQCGLDTCRYSFDCNCTDVKRYKSCEFAYFKQLEADDRLIELPCKVGIRCTQTLQCEGGISVKMTDLILQEFVS